MIGGMYALIKLTAFVTAERRPAGHALAAYLAWPGVNPAPFTRTDPVPSTPAGPPPSTRAPGRARDRARSWTVRGAIVMTAGIAGGAVLTVAAPRLDRAVVGWLGVAVILTTFHLGASDVLSGWRVRRYPVLRLFADPLASRSLREFWSLRWNTAYAEMNRVVFAPLARRWFGRYANAALFALSGLLHEAAISVPVRAGFGGPTVYFLLHAAAVHAESRIRVARWPRGLARLWTWCWVLVPLPLLFHTPFRDGLVAPLFTVWSTR